MYGTSVSYVLRFVSKILNLVQWLVLRRWKLFVFSPPELKAQVSFSDHLSSVVCMSVRPSVCLFVCLYTFHIFIFFSRTMGLISIKLGTKYPWVKGIQVCSNEGPRSFPRGNNYEVVKIHWQNLKIFFSRTTEPISNKFGTKHPWVKGIQFFQMKGPPFSKGR